MDVLESSSLSWIFIPDHHHHPWLATLSWITFFFLTFLVPVLSHFIVYECSDCDINTLRPFDWIVQVSMSLFSTLSYVSLVRFTRKYGLRRFLFLDKMDGVGEHVRKRYTEELHILRLEDFAQVFDKLSDVGPILVEHLTIKRNLRVISHRFRAFILLTLILVTASQFASLLVTTVEGSIVNISTTGELALCSIVLVFGLYICQRSAAKITHKAQSLTSLVTKWHMCATINSFVDMGTTDETPKANVTPQMVELDSDDEVGDGDDELDNTKFFPVYRKTLSYQQRQALVTYFENNESGITVYGFMLDRTSINTVFAIQLSLALCPLSYKGDLVINRLELTLLFAGAFLHDTCEKMRRYDCGSCSSEGMNNENKRVTRTDINNYNIDASARHDDLVINRLELTLLFAGAFLHDTCEKMRRYDCGSCSSEGMNNENKRVTRTDINNYNIDASARHAQVIDIAAIVSFYSQMLLFYDEKRMLQIGNTV
ncbi:hypothetical protein Tco_0011211 [Tanacetum coccineum]